MRTAPIVWSVVLLGLSAPIVEADVPADVRGLIEAGAYAAAEEKLSAVVDRDAPVVGDAAVTLEILRRTRRDFALGEAEVLTAVRRVVPDATPDDVRRWTESNALEHRVIDGEVRYFRKAASNLPRISAEARSRRPRSGSRRGGFSFTPYLRDLVERAEAADDPKLAPLRHVVTYELSVREGHPRVQPGALVRAWLPYPQAYGQQGQVELLESDPPPTNVADNGAPHRSLYCEQVIGDPAEPPRFKAKYAFVTHAYCPQIDPALVEPYDKGSDLFRTYTAERRPHIAFSPEVLELSREIVGDETNPLTTALLIFRWVSDNIPWVGEMEYSIIPNLSEKGLRDRRGDCGVQGMSFTTLCRAAGVPARWQSGWQLRPGGAGMHDWSEIYVEPWGWLPVDASYGARDDPDPRARDFFCGRMDAYRLIVNLDYARPLSPRKTSFRSEPNDFQRGEVEIDGHNLYFDEWRYRFAVESTPVE